MLLSSPGVKLVGVVLGNQRTVFTVKPLLPLSSGFPNKRVVAHVTNDSNCQLMVIYLNLATFGRFSCRILISLVFRDNVYGFHSYP